MSRAADAMAVILENPDWAVAKEQALALWETCPENEKHAVLMVLANDVNRREMELP